MTGQPDLSFLDKQSIIRILFPLAFYPPLYPGSSGGMGLADIFEVEPGVSVGYGFWSGDPSWPTILYYHGNGETVSDYEYVAPLYLEQEINLLVVDYRGYGGSQGTPTITNVLSDARRVFDLARSALLDKGYRDSIFVMGRSIGSLPAVEIMAWLADSGRAGECKGLIVESGAANNFRYRWSEFRPEHDDVLGEDGVFLNKVKVRRVTAPTLVIHGQFDEIIPFREGQELFENSAAEDKMLVEVKGAGHNDIMMVDMPLYFGAIKDFVARSTRGK